MASLGARSRLLLAGILAVALARTVHAEVRVTGRSDAVTVEVRDASVHEALAALSATFGLGVRNSAALDQPVSGTYQGSLQQVVARLLAGRDYVAMHSAGNMEITILGPANGAKVQPVARQPSAAVAPRAPPAVAPRLPPVVAAPAPASTPTVDKGRLMFVPR